MSIKASCLSITGKECADSEVDAFILDDTKVATLLAKAKEKGLTPTSITAMIPAASSSGTSTNKAPITTTTPVDSFEIVFN